MSEMLEVATPTLTRNTEAVEHVFAMRRSGHHAVIAWLQAGYEETGRSVLFANSVYDEHLSYEGQEPDRTPQALWEEAESFDVMIPNYQEVAYSARETIPTYNFLQPDSTGLPARDTVVVRDFYSMVASRLHYMDRYGTEGAEQAKMAAMDPLAVAQCWIDLATTVSRAEDGDPSPIGIVFNRWFTDPVYREELAAKYGLPNSKETLDEVSPLSGGSSFDGLSQQGNARAMNVLRRWSDLSPRLLPGYFEAIGVHRDEIDELNNRLFGFGHADVVATLS
jgi:hypothetical protein